MGGGPGAACNAAVIKRPPQVAVPVLVEGDAAVAPGKHLAVCPRRRLPQVIP